MLTSGGDQIFPKGLIMGTVSKSSKRTRMFLNIKVKPAANLSKLEEVLVITKNEEEQSSLASTKMRLQCGLSDILAERLPSVPDKPKVDPITGKPVETGNPAKPDSSKLANVSSGASTAQKPSVVTTGSSQALSATQQIAERGSSQPRTR